MNPGVPSDLLTLELDVEFTSGRNTTTKRSVGSLLEGALLSVDGELDSGKGFEDQQRGDQKHDEV